MRVFVTGATGFIGSAVVQELLQNGHTVLGLARSDASAEALAKVGVEAHRGELTDHDSLIAGAQACDGVIHTAFIHDFSTFMTNIDTDRKAIVAMGGALAGTDKPFLISSGLLGLSLGGVSTEDSKADPAAPTSGRHGTEEILLAMKDQGVRPSAIRLPPSVHGKGDHGFVPRLVDIAREKGHAAYLGDGSNRWPTVHRVDAARLYRLVLEKAPGGARYHAIAETGVPCGDIARTIGKGLNVPVVVKTQEEAGEYFGFLAMFFGLDSPSTCEKTKAATGWEPTQPTLLADMEANYF